MNRLLFSLVFACATFSAFCSNVSFPLANSTNSLPAFAEVLITPTNLPTVISGTTVVNETLKFKTDANGQLTVSNLYPLTYNIDVTIAGKNTKTHFQITLTNSLSDTSTIAASSIMTAPTNSSPSGTTAYSMAAADARFYPLTSNPSNYVTGAITNGLVPLWTNEVTFYADPRGNNSNDGKSTARPKLTIQAALAAASGGTNIVDLQGGVYDVTTNVIDIPHNVSLRNGTIKSMVDLEVYGVAVVPGNNSVIENLTIICYTNAVFWAGLGSRSNLTATQKAFTNAIVRNVLIRNASTDCWYVDNPSLCTVDISASTLRGYWDQVADNGHNNANSMFRFLGCTIINDGTLANQDLTFGQGSIINVTTGQYEFIGCYGLCTNQSIANGMVNGGNARVYISGGDYQVTPTNGGSFGTLYLGLSGVFNFNGTNISTFQNNVFTGGLIGNGSGLTSLPGANITASTVSSNALDTATKAQLALAGTGTDATKAPTNAPIIFSGTNVGAFTTHFLASSGSAPTVATNGFGAGTTATVSIMAGSTDIAMDLIVNAGGTGNINSNICFITFNQPFPNNKVPHIAIQQNGIGAYAGRFAYDRNNSTTNGIQIIAAGTAPAAGTSYTNTIIVVQ